MLIYILGCFCSINFLIQEDFVCMLIYILGCFCSINFCFCFFLERTCIFLNNMFIFAFFPVFKKREKLVDNDGLGGRKHFFSLNKRNVSESTIFFSLRSSLFGVFFSSFLLMFKK